MKNKFFNNRKYLLHKNRWERTTHPHISLSHDVWNFFFPKDNIKENEVIHHINGNPSDDDLKNLQKLENNEHIRLHQMGEKNSNWKDGSSRDEKAYGRKYNKNIKSKVLFSIYDSMNHFSYSEVLIYNLKTYNISLIQRWDNY